MTRTALLVLAVLAAGVLAGSPVLVPSVATSTSGRFVAHDGTPVPADITGTLDVVLDISGRNPVPAR